MHDISIHRDQKSGLLKARISPANKVLEEFLETEIQNDLRVIDYLTERTLDAAIHYVDTTGNAFSLKLTADSYFITPLYENDIPPQEGPLDEFLYLLNQWRDFLKKENMQF